MSSANTRKREVSTAPNKRDGGQQDGKKWRDRNIEILQLDIDEDHHDPRTSAKKRTSPSLPYISMEDRARGVRSAPPPPPLSPAAAALRQSPLQRAGSSGEDDELLQFDVGGRYFRTYASNLQPCKYEFHEGISVDADPDAFTVVLNYLRRGVWSNPLGIEDELLRAELKFFGLEAVERKVFGLDAVEGGGAGPREGRSFRGVGGKSSRSGRGRSRSSRRDRWSSGSDEEEEADRRSSDRLRARKEQLVFGVPQGEHQQMEEEFSPRYGSQPSLIVRPDPPTGEDGGQTLYPASPTGSRVAVKKKPSVLALLCLMLADSLFSYCVHVRKMFRRGVWGCFCSCLGGGFWPEPKKRFFQRCVAASRSGAEARHFALVAVRFNSIQAAVLLLCTCVLSNQAQDEIKQYCRAKNVPALFVAVELGFGICVLCGFCSLVLFGALYIEGCLAVSARNFKVFATVAEMVFEWAARAQSFCR